jgi:hypothetical protein
MKKLIATVICLVALATAAIPVDAQTRNRRNQQRYSQRYDTNRVYRDQDYRYDRDRSVWDKHRDKITTAGGAVGGAIIGGLIGGKKGAIIGAIAGGGGAALYTYKLRDKDGRRYYRR